MIKLNFTVLVICSIMFSCGTEKSSIDTSDFTEAVFTAGIEGPAVSNEGILYAVNFQKEGTVGMVDQEGKAEIFIELPEGSTGNGIRFDKHGYMYVADYTGHKILQIDLPTKDIHVYAHNPSMNQPNDIAITDLGILFASDPNWSDSTGKLWRIDMDGSTILLEDSMGTTNGIEVSPDNKRLYVNESIQRNVWVYDLDENGNISNKRLHIKFDDFGMDGMRTDIEGNLYITRFGKGTVAVVSPEGKLVREIKLKGEKPTNVAFGGKDNKTIFVTMQDRMLVETFENPIAGRE
ncbi:MAG: SMP-30/gluconolactonase/LRE family protein [Cytophagaceae bacterium]